MSRGGAVYAVNRLKGNLDFSSWLRQQLGDLRPQVAIPANARAKVHRFRLGPNQLLAFERNISYQMSEDLKQAGGNEPLEVPVEVEAQLPRAAHVYDLRAERYLGHIDRLKFTLDPWQPSLFALTPEKLESDKVVAELSGSGR